MHVQRDPALRVADFEVGRMMLATAQRPWSLGTNGLGNKRCIASGSTRKLINIRRRMTPRSLGTRMGKT
jgi:hypothetical protein